MKKTERIEEDQAVSYYRTLPMPTRRRFIGTLCTLLMAGPVALAGELNRRRERWEMLTHEDVLIAAPHRPVPDTWDNTTITAAWIGHSTVLLNILGTKIITDPVFSERIGLNVAGLFTIGPKRLVLPALRIDQLPPIDLILLSHAHLDHLDIPSLKQLDRTIPVVMAKNTADLIEDLGFETVYELDWGKWTAIGDLRIEALEVVHFGWRYPWEQDRSRGYENGRSYNAYLLSKNGKQVVFGGDTTYHEKFTQLRDRGMRVDLAIMPIGAYDPWITYHANPEQALSMADHMGAHYVLPIHWRTFIQSQEPTVEPIERLRRAAGESPDRVVLDSIGQTWAMPVAPVDTAIPAETAVSPAP